MNNRLPIIITPQAERDIEDAFDCYQSKDRDLGAKFLARLEMVLASVGDTPESRAVVDGIARLALVSRFPFGVCSTFDETAIFVHAVFTDTVPHRLEILESMTTLWSR